MTGPEGPDNLTSMESATETIKRIFGGSDSPLGSQIADESTRYRALQKAVCPKPEQTRLIAVANQKGGVGKTTSAVNLSAALAQFGSKVLLIDMDPQGNASTALGAPHASGEPSVYDVIEGRKTIAEVKRTCPDFDLLDVVPASIDLSGAELEVADMENRNVLLKTAVDEFLETSEEHYDYVIIDTAPVGLVTDTLQIARVADLTVYMCRADYTPKSSFNLINGLSSDHKLPKVSIVINGIDMSKKKYGYYYGYGKYGKYGQYGNSGSNVGYGSFGSYGSYGNYSNSGYGNKNDKSIKA